MRTLCPTQQRAFSTLLFRLSPLQPPVHQDLIPAPSLHLMNVTPIIAPTLNFEADSETRFQGIFHPPSIRERPKTTLPKWVAE